MKTDIFFAQDWLCWISLIVLGTAFLLRTGSKWGWFVKAARKRALKWDDPAKRRNMLTNWTVNGLLTREQAERLQAELCPDRPVDALPVEAYAPPALTETEEGRAHGAALKLATIQKYPLRVLRFGELILENMRLLKEVNDLRDRLGIPPREVHDV